MEVPDAWRIRERVFKRWDRRKGEVWEEFSPLERRDIVSFGHIMLEANTKPGVAG